MEPKKGHFRSKSSHSVMIVGLKVLCICHVFTRGISLSLLRHQYEVKISKTAALDDVTTMFDAPPG